MRTTALLRALSVSSAQATVAVHEDELGRIDGVAGGHTDYPHVAIEVARLVADGRVDRALLAAAPASVWRSRPTRCPACAP